MSEVQLGEFTSRYPFELDSYQLQAMDALTAGQNVLVCAPTGSGKTVVGEFAVWLATTKSKRAFYTTPIKALSNQKFLDLGRMHGPENVGLLTGDNAVNQRAPVIVMTTEVLRNMIYDRSEVLDDVGYVVLDEVHYLQDPYRGAVWEEVIIHLPRHVQIASLSATVSNAQEFSEWIQTVRGPTTSVVETRRSVPMQPHHLLGGRLYPMFIDSSGKQVPNPEIPRIERSLSRSSRTSSDRARRGPRRSTKRVRRFPDRAEIANVLEREHLLPAIYFIFSRKGCDFAVEGCLRSSLELTDRPAAKTIRDIALNRTAHIDPDDLEVLEFDNWLRGLERGFAAHHAGLVPAFKETVEELFREGFVKLVFATETLSLGINMPARSVVIESLTKFTGEKHEVLTPAEFTQFTGRAGRRGIDEVGYSVTLPQPDLPFRQVAALATDQSFPLLSSFRPSYNMAANLARNYSREEAEHLLNSSFSQFRSNKEVVALESRLASNRAYLASYSEKMNCHAGDFVQYWQQRRQEDARLHRKRKNISANAKRGVQQMLNSVKPGDVLVSGKPPQAKPVAIVGHDRSRGGDARVVAITIDRRVVRLSPSDFSRPHEPIARVNLGKQMHGRQSRPWKALGHDARRRIAGKLEDLLASSLEETEATLTEPPSYETHPCHSCPDIDEHIVWAKRADASQRQISEIAESIRRHSDTLNIAFGKVLDVLEKRGYISGFSLQPKGSMLSKIYNENDLVLAEALDQGAFGELDADELAAIVCTLVFESRGPNEIRGELPTKRCAAAYRKLTRITRQVKTAESKAGLALTRGIESGLAGVMYRWSRGAHIEDVLDDQLTPGDFIRSCRQTLDLLRQLGQASSDRGLRDLAAASGKRIDRGVVADTGFD